MRDQWSRRSVLECRPPRRALCRRPDPGRDEHHAGGRTDGRHRSHGDRRRPGRERAGLRAAGRAAHPCRPADHPGHIGPSGLRRLRANGLAGRRARLQLGEDAPRPSGRVEPIYWHAKGLGIPLRTARGVAGVHFDSGADATTLFLPARDLLSPRELAAAVNRTIHLGGAGGVVERQVQQPPRVALSVVGLALTLENLSLMPGADVASRAPATTSSNDRPASCSISRR